MLQELCRDSFFKACKMVSYPLLQVRGSSSPFIDFYGNYGELEFVHYRWHRLPLSMLNTGPRDGVARTRRRAWVYFNENADRMREHYLRVAWGRDLERAMMESRTFEALFEGFYGYFERRRSEYMEKVNRELEARTLALASVGKHPQSHGGVANLLKVLTKTMHDQGSSVYTIAKVQYAVCMQAGIFIPDDFLTDVMVAHEMIEEG